MAIIADNHEENITKIAMSDDGSGAGIRIPSMMISEEDGNKLLTFMRTATDEEKAQVSVLVEFDMRRPDNRVEYDVWYSSTNDIALDFIQDFKAIDKKLGYDVQMAPRFVFWECKNCEDNFRDSHCFGGGAYCATDGSNSLSGQDVILEDLRQMCVYK